MLLPCLSWRRRILHLILNSILLLKLRFSAVLQGGNRLRCGVDCRNAKSPQLQMIWIPSLAPRNRTVDFMLKRCPSIRSLKSSVRSLGFKSRRFLLPGCLSHYLFVSTGLWTAYCFNWLAVKPLVDKCYCLEINCLSNMSSGSFSDDPTRVAHVVVIAVFSFLAVLAVILRLWARRIQRMRLDLSDYLIIVALVRIAPGGMLRRCSDV